MIAALKGKIIFQGTNYLVVAVNDVGYKVFVGAPLTFSIGEVVSLHIHHHVSEDASNLYGFKDFDELQFFELLLGVPGIGPKLALTIVSSQTLAKLRAGIVDSDPTALQAIAGVGGKLASKIIVELRPKLAKGQADLGGLSRDDEELVSALGQLGWRRQEVSSVVRQLPKGTIDERLKHALKVMGS